MGCVAADRLQARELQSSPDRTNKDSSEQPRTEAIEEGDESLQAEKIEKPNEQRRQETSFQKPNPTAPGISQERRYTSGETSVIKRTKTNVSIPQVELNTWQKNLDGWFLEEPNGSTIVC